MFVIINIINLVKWEFDNLVQTTVLFHEEVATRTGWPLLPDVGAPVPGRKITVIVHQIFFLPKQLTAFRNTAKNALTCCSFPHFAYVNWTWSGFLLSIWRGHCVQLTMCIVHADLLTFSKPVLFTTVVQGVPFDWSRPKSSKRIFDIDRAEGATDRFRFQHF